jgi:HK97 family phage prohead protease
MLRFEMDVAGANLDERTIEGVIVPYGEVGTIGGTDYRFTPGSVRAARARTPLLVDHDRAQPIGALAELVETESGLVGRFRVDATPAGDQALVQAASGSRGSLSLGAEVVACADAGAIVEVSEALLLEASLLALGAFPSAAVLRVAAELDEPAPDEPAPDEPAPDDDDNDDDDDDDDDEEDDEELDEDEDEDGYSEED